MALGAPLSPITVEDFASPKGFGSLAGERLPRRYARALDAFRHGPGAAKVGFLVSEPFPGLPPKLGMAGTVHFGGTQAEMFRQETLTAWGVRTDEPFVLLVDPAVADPNRAWGGMRPVWAYAHVPNGDSTDPEWRLHRPVGPRPGPNKAVRARVSLDRASPTQCLSEWYGTLQSELCRR